MFTVAFFSETLNTACRWSKQSAKKNILSIAKVVTLQVKPKFWVMEYWSKWCKERTRKTISIDLPVGVDVMARCYFSIYLWSSSSSWCCIILASFPSLMIICSFSSRLFVTVKFEKLSSSCCNNVARIASLSVAVWNPSLIDVLDIWLCHWHRIWVDGAQCKCKCWFVF